MRSQGQSVLSPSLKSGKNITQNKTGGSDFSFKSTMIRGPADLQKSPRSEKTGFPFIGMSKQGQKNQVGGVG